MINDNARESMVAVETRTTRPTVEEILSTFDLVDAVHLQWDGLLPWGSAHPQARLWGYLSNERAAAVARVAFEREWPEDAAKLPAVPHVSRCWVGYYPNPYQSGWHALRFGTAGGDRYPVTVVDFNIDAAGKHAVEPEKRTSKYNPITVDYALDQITDPDRLRELVRQFRKAMVGQHEFVDHLIEDRCEGCARATQYLDPDYACADYRRWQAMYSAALNAI